MNLKPNELFSINDKLTDQAIEIHTLRQKQDELLQQLADAKTENADIRHKADEWRRRYEALHDSASPDPLPARSAEQYIRISAEKVTCVFHDTNNAVVLSLLYALIIRAMLDDATPAERMWLKSLAALTYKKAEPATNVSIGQAQYVAGNDVNLLDPHQPDLPHD